MWQHSLEDAAFTNVEVPVVGASDDQLLLLLRRGCHGGRPQVRARRSAEADAARRGQPEEGGRRRLRVRVRADGGGGGAGAGAGDGGLHWVRSLHSVSWPLRGGERGVVCLRGLAGARCGRAGGGVRVPWHVVLLECLDPTGHKARAPVYLVEGR